MITCNNCRHRRSFNIDTGKKIIKTNICMMKFTYVNLGIVYVDCPMNIDEYKERKRRKNKKGCIMRFIEKLKKLI
jgi:uncharacterized membrane protein (UPF0127 family)